jgi:hypothetical protein
VVLIGVFVAIGLRSAAPLIPFRIFRLRTSDPARMSSASWSAPR